MTSITITINLDSLGVENEDGEIVLNGTTNERIEREVVNRIVEKFIDNRDYEGERVLDQKMLNTIDEAVRERISDLLYKPIQRVSRYNGQPEGDPTSIESLTEAAVQKYLGADGRGNNSYGNDPKNLPELITKVVTGFLNKELALVADEAKKKITATILNEAAAAAAKAIAPKQF